MCIYHIYQLFSEESEVLNKICHGHVYRQQTYMYMHAFILTEDDKTHGRSDG